jgi:hypothetical protein
VSFWVWEMSIPRRLTWCGIELDEEDGRYRYGDVVMFDAGGWRN